MKKVLVLLSILLAGVLLGGCSAQKDAQLPVRSYAYEESTEVIKPAVVLEDENWGTFSYSLLSSYMAAGTYDIKENRFTLKTDDGKNTYCFTVKDEVLYFDAKASSALPSYADIPDGAVFK